MKLKIVSASVLFVLAAAIPAPAVPAAMSGGAFSVPLFSTLSGGGSASGGALSIAPMSLGGPSYSASAPSGGAFTLVSGAAPALVIADAARPGLGVAHCYPVPFKPSAGHTRITFTGLTRQASVKIYTISGELVRSLQKNDVYDFIEWDAKNSRGRNVASGVYFYTVKGGGETASGKLMIIW